MSLVQQAVAKTHHSTPPPACPTLSHQSNPTSPHLPPALAANALVNATITGPARSTSFSSNCAILILIVCVPSTSFQWAATNSAAAVRSSSYDPTAGLNSCCATFATVRLAMKAARASCLSSARSSRWARR